MKNFIVDLSLNFVAILELYKLLVYAFQYEYAVELVTGPIKVFNAPLW